MAAVVVNQVVVNQHAHVVETRVTRPLRESKEWLMNSKPQLRLELEKLILPRKLRRLPKMQEKKWKEWPTNKKRMLLTRKLLMQETKPLRKQRRLLQVLELVLLPMPLSRKLKTLLSQ